MSKYFPVLNTNQFMQTILFRLNLRPIIGILDQPSPSDSDCNLVGNGDKYLAAAYVKLVESTGARVVPIPFDATEAELERLFSAVNGIVLPGGDSNFTPGTVFYDNANYLFHLALKANQQGDYFSFHWNLSRNGNAFSYDGKFKL